MPAKVAVYKTKRGRVMDRPPGTRCYVPGFQDSATQFEIDQQQLGVAPLAVAAAAKAGGLKISFKKGSPRYMGGPLVRTVDAAMQRVASGEMAIISRLNQLRQMDKDKRAWQGVWENELPKQPLTSAQYALVKQLDPSLPVSPPAAVTGPAPALPPAPGTPTPQPPVTGPAPIAWPWAPPPAPAPAPGTMIITLPTPPPSLPGGEAPIPPAPETTGPVTAGMGGDLGKMLIPGLILLGISMMLGKKRR